jgi:hypothetical protein
MKCLSICKVVQNWGKIVGDLYSTEKTTIEKNQISLESWTWLTELGERWS